MAKINKKIVFLQALMKKILFSFLSYFLLISILTGCDPYHKLAKSKNAADKETAALGYYGKQKYAAADPLLEELYPIYRGLARGERILWTLAETKYHLGYLLLAAFYYAEFAKLYPSNTEKYIDARYKEAYCYYLMSPSWELDQENTYKAIEKFQLFLLQFPNSSKYSKEKIEAYLKDLNQKLAYKAFRQAKLYYDLERYKAAKIAFKNLTQEYPDITNIEEIYYYWFLSAYKLAQNSIPEKQPERYTDALKIYLKFATKFPNSAFLLKIEKYYELIQKKLSQYNDGTS